MKAKTLVSLLRNNFKLNPRHMSGLARYGAKLWLERSETRHQFEAVFGDFHFNRDCRPHRRTNPSGEGGSILGEVVLMAKEAPVNGAKVLLAGDRNEVKQIWADVFPLPTMTTAGVHSDMDHYWNFEDDPPSSLRDQRFALIVSQATLEHLIDPYKHVRDLAALLDLNGSLVVHTVTPGYQYHRFPIDCFRFYPDWFHTIAERLDLTIIDKQISTFQITYKFRNNKNTG